MSISEKKFNKVLTGILVVVVTGIVVVGAVFGRSIVEKIIQNKEAENAVNEFDQRVTARRASSTGQQTNTTNELENLTFDPSLFANNETTENTSDNGVVAKQTYKGYAVAGKIEIPKTKLNMVVLDRSTKESMEVAVGIAYGPGLNKVGNTVILGHNYRNNSFFSNNDKIEEGDPIYITDSETGTNPRIRSLYPVPSQGTFCPEPSLGQAEAHVAVGGHRLPGRGGKDQGQHGRADPEDHPRAALYHDVRLPRPRHRPGRPGDPGGSGGGREEAGEKASLLRHQDRPGRVL